MSNVRDFAPTFVKRIVWDRKHRNVSVDAKRCPHDLLECLSTLEPDAEILDLGCGAGNLRAALRSLGWKGHFIGVDVSQKAIDAAKESQDVNAEWHVSAIEDFGILNQKVGAICLCESLYYVKLGLVPAMLARCRHALKPRGRIVVRIWNSERHREYVALLMSMGVQSNPPIYVLTKD